MKGAFGEGPPRHSRPRSSPGLVKIGYADLIRGERPLEAGNFTSLGPGHDRRLYWFSVGQNDSYYDNIRALGPMLRGEILDGLCDIAYDEDLFDQAMMWDVTHASSLHAVAPQTVGVQFRRIAWGGLQFTDYDFSHVAPAPPREEAPPEPWRLSFAVRPHSTPPTNVHVLIGRNGVGKTTLLSGLTSAVMNPEQRGADKGRIEGASAPGTFVNVVSVTFSAFDPAQERAEGESGQGELRGWDSQNGHRRVPPSVAYQYVGLAKVDELGRPTGERGRSGLCTGSVEAKAPLPGRLEREADCQLEGPRRPAVKQQQNMTVIRRDLPPSIDGGAGGLDACGEVQAGLCVRLVQPIDSVPAHWLHQHQLRPHSDSKGGCLGLDHLEGKQAAYGDGQYLDQLSADHQLEVSEICAARRERPAELEV